MARILQTREIGTGFCPGWSGGAGNLRYILQSSITFSTS